MNKLILLVLLTITHWFTWHLWWPSKIQVLPKYQRLRINDTLTLEVSQPLARFMIPRSLGHLPKQAQSSKAILWGRAALHGRRGYYELLNPGLPYCTLYLAVASPKGDVLALPYWNDIEKQVLIARAHPLDTVWIDRSNDFGYWRWDVRYRTWSLLLGADLSELPPPTEGEEEYGFESSVVSFTGGRYHGQDYHLLPYWLDQELSRVRHSRRLPQQPLLGAFLDLAYDQSGRRLAFAYRPLLAKLLQAYASCPQSPATSRQIAEARQLLSTTRQP